MSVIDHTPDVLRELRALRKGLDKLRAELRAAAEATPSRDGAVKRAVAAKLMGIGGSKLDALIAKGKVATCDDVRLVPMAEVRRFCAPKPKRLRKPSIGVRALRRMKSEDWTAESKAELRRKLKAVTG